MTTDAADLPFDTATEALRRDNDDVKERVGKIESVKEGTKQANTNVIAIITTAAAVIGVAVVLAAYIASH